MSSDLMIIFGSNYFYYSLVVFLFFILGAGIKFIDQTFDKKNSNDQKLALAISIVCGLIIGTLISIDYFSSILLIGIIVGVILANKIDNIAFFIGLVFVVLISVLLNFYSNLHLNFVLIAVIAFASLIDEIGNDLADKGKLSGVINWFFVNRFVLKVTVLVMFFLNLLPFVYLLAFLAFDVAYYLMEKYR